MQNRCKWSMKNIWLNRHWTSADKINKKGTKAFCQMHFAIVCWEDCLILSNPYLVKRFVLRINRCTPLHRLIFIWAMALILFHMLDFLMGHKRPLIIDELKHFWRHPIAYVIPYDTQRLNSQTSIAHVSFSCIISIILRVLDKLCRSNVIWDLDQHCLN